MTTYFRDFSISVHRQLHLFFFFLTLASYSVTGWIAVYFRASQVVLVVKNLPASAGDIRTMGSIPGLVRSPGEGMATHSSILAWRIPWTEEPGGYSS